MRTFEDGRIYESRLDGHGLVRRRIWLPAKNGAKQDLPEAPVVEVGGGRMGQPPNCAFHGVPKR
jgi:hypothetical protein